MKQFKKMDCIIQIVLLVTGFAWNLAGISRGRFLGNSSFAGAYVAVGGWQLVSVIAHMVQPRFNKKIPRRIYLVMLLVVILGAVTTCCFWKDAVILFFSLLLFASPFMAVYYCVVCIRETKALANSGRMTKQA